MNVDLVWYPIIGGFVSVAIAFAGLWFVGAFETQEKPEPPVAAE